jgi:hypothetical protein
VGAGAAEAMRRAAGRPKLFQIIPSKTKQNSLDLLGFIRPNRDFSKAYSYSK